MCPCHGSEFDPAAQGQPVSGPAVQPLPQVPISVDKAQGVVRLA